MSTKWAKLFQNGIEIHAWAKFVVISTSYYILCPEIVIDDDERMVDKNWEIFSSQFFENWVNFLKIR